MPSPVKPSLHSQLKLPGVLVQVASREHEAAPLLHSSTSVQVMPLPTKPAGHAPHENPPGVFVQVTGGAVEQPPLLVAHSSTSVQP
jgi:hypothetical protein